MRPKSLTLNPKTSTLNPQHPSDIVKIHYTGFLEGGQEFENTREKDPLEFQVGSDRVVSGIDAAVCVCMCESQKYPIPFMVESRKCLVLRTCVVMLCARLPPYFGPYGPPPSRSLRWNVYIQLN